MPFINADTIPAGIKADFFKETGLTLAFNDQRESDDSITIRTILRQKMHTERRSTCLNSDLYYYYSGNLFRLYRFRYCDTVMKIKNDFMKLYCLDIDIHDSDGCPVDGNMSLDDINTELIKPEPDWNKLAILNKKLTQVEKDIRIIWERINPRIKREISSGRLMLTDYELEVKLQFFLDKNDPLFIEDSENLIIEQFHCLSKCSRDDILNDGTDYSDFNAFPGGNSDRQCRLFHDLHACRNLNYCDMQRIGSLWMDFKIYLQKDYEL